MRIVGVIPARYESSRFQGKPLADICGKPMVWWVYQHASQVKYFDELYVATDDRRIYDACMQYDMKCIMTSTAHRTGTDRIGEVAEKIPADLYVNIQGDEPLLDPLMIDEVAELLNASYCATLCNEMQSDFENPNAVKVVMSQDNYALYFSRSLIPYQRNKNNIKRTHKNVNAVWPRMPTFVSQSY